LANRQREVLLDICKSLAEHFCFFLRNESIRDLISNYTSRKFSSLDFLACVVIGVLLIASGAAIKVYEYKNALAVAKARAEFGEKLIEGLPNKQGGRDSSSKSGMTCDTDSARWSEISTKVTCWVTAVDSLLSAINWTFIRRMFRNLPFCESAAAIIVLSTQGFANLGFSCDKIGRKKGRITRILCNVR